MKEVDHGLYGGDERDMTEFLLQIVLRGKWGWVCVHETWAIVMDHVTKKWPGSTCSLHVKHQGESCFEILMIKNDESERLVYSRLNGDPKHLHHHDIKELLLDKIEAFLHENWW